MGANSRLGAYSNKYGITKRKNDEYHGKKKVLKRFNLIGNIAGFRLQSQNLKHFVPNMYCRLLTQ